MNTIITKRIKKPRNYIEHKNQKAIVQYLRLHKDRPLFHKNTNEGKRSAVLGKFMKEEGLVSGVPDLFICEPRGRYHGLYLEVKADIKSKVTLNQQSFMEKLRKNGYRAEVCYTVDQGLLIINAYLSL